jgi:hypothetical protein
MIPSPPAFAGTTITALLAPSPSPRYADSS